MQRAFASRARSSVLNSSSKLRTSSFNLQQQRFAHKELKFGVEGRAALLAGVGMQTSTNMLELNPF